MLEARLGVGLAVRCEEEVALPLSNRVSSVTSGRDGPGQRAGFVLEEAPNGQKILVDLGGPGARAFVLEELERQRFEGDA